MVIRIGERHVEYANKVASFLRGETSHFSQSRGEVGHPGVGVRVEVDARNEKMNAKIREHAMQKVPFMLVVGDKEAETGKVNVGTRGKERTEDMGTEEFATKIRSLVSAKSPTL